MKKIQQDNSWVSFSDIMTGLMIVFMFITIALIVEVNRKNAERDQMFKDFRNVKEELYDELNTAFKDDFLQWQFELDDDLSIKFTNPEVLFASGQKEINSNFQIILDKFIPKYLAIVLQEKYKNNIYEIRIEGHTDEVPAPRYGSDPYMSNVILSQLRSSEVLNYIRNTVYFKNISQSKKELLQFWMTANGLSYGRTLDSSKNLTIKTGNEVNNELSRRVEFKIVTNADEIVEKIIKGL